jgi:hypothetical protein
MTQVQDWSAYEVADEAELHPAEDAEKVVNIPQSEREQYLAMYQQRVNALVPMDDLTVKSCGEFVEQCKLAAKRVEDKRTALTEPLNKQVKDINAIYMPVRDAFQGMAKAVTMRVNKFLDDRRRAAELEQQRLLAEAAKKQAELDKKAQEAKAKAAQALESGDEVAATVLESKVAIFEQKAAEVVPMQVAVPNGKVELETSTVSFGGAKKVWGLTGWDKKKPLRVLDPSLASLVGDLSKLPEGVRFIMQHSDLNPVYLNASYKGGMKFPAPFADVNDYGGSRVR